MMTMLVTRMVTMMKATMMTGTVILSDTAGHPLNMTMHQPSRMVTMMTATATTGMIILSNTAGHPLKYDNAPTLQNSQDINNEDLSGKYGNDDDSDDDDDVV
eukprot:5533173-Ditylum_brightwellii.AAC.1